MRNAERSVTVDASARAALLLECLGPSPARTIASALDRLSGEGWSALVDDATRQGVAPLVHGRLQAAGVAAGPSAAAGARERLRDVYVHNALRNAAVLDELAGVLALLRGAGVPVIALKGAHLACCVYDDPALRPMADLDLLLRPADLPRVARLLAELGYASGGRGGGGIDYEKHHHVRPLHKAGAVPIELHRTITAPDGPLRIDLDGLWHRARTAPVAGVEALVLSPEDLLLHLCLHAAYNHRFQVPLLSLCDVAAVVERHGGEIDWPRLAAVANEAGAGRLLHGTLCFVQRSLRARIPALALEALDNNDGDREVADAIRDCILAAPVDLPVALERLDGREGIGGTLWALLRSVFPSRERLAAMYGLTPGSALVSWYYFVRPVDLLVRRGKVAVEYACQAPSIRPALEWRERRHAVERWVERASRGRR